MSSKKNDALPEFVTEDTTFKSLERIAEDARQQVNIYQAKEKLAKKGKHPKKGMEKIGLEDIAKIIVMEQFEKKNVIGKIVTTFGNATRTELRITNAAVNVNQKDYLEGLFGATMFAALFQESTKAEITDPMELITALQNAGLNPADHLTFSVKANHDAVVAKYPGTNSIKVLKPVTGFIARVKENITMMSSEALDYLKKYLKGVLQPTVVLGTKK